MSAKESVAFDASLQDQVRARVLEELAAVNARQTESRWPGQAPLQLQSPRPFHCDLRPWSVVRVPMPVVTSQPSSRPGLAARAARSALHAALEARWAAIDAQLLRAAELPENEAWTYHAL